MAKGVRLGGRQKGTPNKLTASVKEAFHAAYIGIGGDSALAEWGQANRTEFYKIYARMLPRPLEIPDGADSGSLTITWQKS